MQPQAFHNRALNHAYSTYEQLPDGTWRECKHPFPCDDCGLEAAKYGCIEEHGKWLRRLLCHLQVTRETAPHADAEGAIASSGSNVET